MWHTAAIVAEPEGSPYSLQHSPLKVESSGPAEGGGGGGSFAELAGPPASPAHGPSHNRNNSTSSAFSEVCQHLYCGASGLVVDVFCFAVVVAGQQPCSGTCSRCISWQQLGSHAAAPPAGCAHPLALHPASPPPPPKPPSCPCPPRLPPSAPARLAPSRPRSITTAPAAPSSPGAASTSRWRLATARSGTATAGAWGTARATCTAGSCCRRGWAARWTPARVSLWQAAGGWAG